MMNSRALQPSPTSKQRTAQLRAELGHAQQLLLTIEATLGQKQATVNAFRMQCRLKIGELVDEVLRLRAEKQRCLTEWQLRQQAEAMGLVYDEANPFAFAQEDGFEVEEELLLPDLPEMARDAAAAKRLYRQLARRFHPDLSANFMEQAYRTSVMAAINTAYSAGDVQTLRDLADELNPDELAELAAIETTQERQLRERIMNLKRRQRKMAKQLQDLQQESTTILCEKAERLAARGRNWWDEIKRDLEREIGRRQQEIHQLNQHRQP